jgi:hypothetical protein
MIFVVESSNKLQKTGFRRENELSVFIIGANNKIMLSIHEGRQFVLVSSNDMSQTIVF